MHYATQRDAKAQPGHSTFFLRIVSLRRQLGIIKSSNSTNEKKSPLANILLNLQDPQTDLDTNNKSPLMD